MMAPVFGWRNKSREIPAESPPLDYLNLGCGTRFHPDWVNIDIVARGRFVRQHDLRQPLPFADGTFSVVYHSHVLEHLTRDCARALLRECRRVLKSRGILRIAVPDLETIVRLYLENLEGALEGDEAAAARYDWIVLELLDQMTREESGGEMGRYLKQGSMPAADFIFSRMGEQARRAQDRQAKAKKPHDESFRESGEIHKWMYDRYSLGQLLLISGFADARACRADESAIPRFMEFHLDTDDTGAVRKPDSLFMEAIKPA